MDLNCLSLTSINLANIDPIHKWLPIKNSFVIFKISLTNLVLELSDNSKEFSLSKEVSWANLNAYKRNLNWQPFVNRVYIVEISSHIKFMQTHDQS